MEAVYLESLLTNVSYADREFIYVFPELEVAYTEGMESGEYLNLRVSVLASKLAEGYISLLKEKQGVVLKPFGVVSCGALLAAISRKVCVNTRPYYSHSKISLESKNDTKN